MKTGDHIEKPWGWEQIVELNDRYCIKHLFVKPGHRFSQQYHERKRETLILISGSADLLLRPDGVTEQAMVEGEAHPIAPGTVHRVRGTGPEGALILEVSTPDVDDVVRLEDDYGRG